MTVGHGGAGRSPHSRYAGARWWAFGFGLLCTVLMVWWQASRNDALARERLHSDADVVRHRVEARMRTYEYGLRGLRGVMFTAGADRFTRAQFDAYSSSRNPAVEFPGARGFGVVRLARASGLSAVVANIRANGVPAFEIRSLGPNDGDRYLVQYVAPFEANRTAIGVDLASEPRRREAAQRAVAEGRASITAPLTLVGTGERATGTPGFVLFLGAYRTPRAPTTRAERERQLVGWTIAPLVATELFQGLDEELELLTLSLRDAADIGAPPFFASHDANLPATAGLETRPSVAVYGRTWVATVRATPAYVASLNLRDPRMVGLAGVGLSLLLAGLGHLYGASRSRAEAVRAERWWRAAIVDGSGEAILALDLAGVVTDWNRGAEHLFGWKAEEAVGRHVDSLIVPPGYEDEASSIMLAVVNGASIPSLETVRRRRDASLVDVAIHASPIVGPSLECAGVSGIIRDIGEAKREERRVREANANLEALVRERTALLESAHHDLQTIVDATPAMIGYWDRELVLRFANRALARTLDPISASPTGRHVPQLVSEARWRTLRPHVDAALLGERRTLEQSIVAPDGRSRHLLAHLIPDSVEGQVRGTYVIVHDVTELTESRLQLRSSEAFLERAGQVAGVGGWELELSSERLTWSAQTFRIHEVEPGFVPTLENALAFYPPAARVEIEAAVQRAMSTGEGWDVELPLITARGRRLWVRATGSVDRVRGVPVRLIGAFQDVTARKDAELERLHTSSLLQSVLESASEVSLIATDPDLVITVFNSGAERLLGYSSEDVVGRATPLLIHDAAEVAARAQELMHELGRSVRGGEVFTDPSTLRTPREWTYVAKDGARIRVSLVVTAMHAEDGTVLGYLGVAHDVTRQKEAEATMRAAMEQARKANQAKSHFLANMSHEIRTPMNAVMGLSYLLGQSPLTSEQALLLDKIVRASRSLLGVINDILDLSKIEAGELVVERVAFDPRAVVEEVTALLGMQAEAKGVKFSSHVASDVPAFLIGDPTRVRQILTNLASNAIKFTPQGAVSVRVWWDREDVRGETHDEVVAFASSGASGAPAAVGAVREEGVLRLAVADTGIGMSPEVLARLFTPFAQADETTTRRFGGTGLGLSIVKRLATLMEGTVEVESHVGRGSTFGASLPMAIVTAGNGAPGALPSGHGAVVSLAGIRVLVVDDSEVNLEVARRILELAGATVSLARDGGEALDLLRDAQSAIDVVLMDVQMPVLDGYEATRRLRMVPRLSALPVIALTAGALVSERERAMAVGMDGFVTKPFEPEGLLRTVFEHARGGTTPARGDVEPVTDDAPAPRVPPADAPGPNAPAARVDDSGAAAWPSIAGIDGGAARERFGGDIELFRRLLRHFLEEYEDLREARRPDDAVELHEWARRMHKLRGSVAALGGEQLHAAAEAAERVCRARDDASVAAALAAVRRDFLALHEGAKGWLASESKPLASPETDDDVREARTGALAGTASALDLGPLLQLLRDQDLRAAEQLEGQLTVLRRRLGTGAMHAVRSHVQRLEFPEAVRIIEEALEGTPDVALPRAVHAEGD